MGSRIGILKVAAKRIGLSLEEYQRRIDSGQKWCHMCGMWKFISEFGVDRNRSDKRHAVCKACRYLRSSPGPSKEKRREMLGQGFRWCRRCESWLPVTQVYAGLCRKHANEETRRRYATDRRFRLERIQHARSRKRGVGPIPPQAQELLLEEFEGLCAYCDEPATTWDHIVAVRRGGQSTPGNVVPACFSCNSSKKDNDVFVWLERMGRKPSERLIDRLLLADAGHYS